MKPARIKKGWHEAGRKLFILGEPIRVNVQDWTPIIFDGDEDPTYMKTAAVEEIAEPIPDNKEFQWNDAKVKELLCDVLSSSSIVFADISKSTDNILNAFKEKPSCDINYLAEQPSVRDWEVVAFIDKHGNLHKSHHYHPDTFSKMHLEKYLKIHSVKRKDGDIFTIGDFVKVIEPVRKGWSDPITGFLISGDTMVAEFATWRQPLNDLERMHKEIKVTAAETYDGGKTNIFTHDEPWQYVTENPRTVFEKNKSIVEEYEDAMQSASAGETVTIKLSKEQSDKFFTDLNKLKSDFPSTYPEPTAQPKKPSRIEVQIAYGHLISSDGRLYHLWVNNNKWIPEEKYHAIKQAIEAVLNDDTKKEWWQKLGIKFDGKWYTHPKTNTYDNLDRVVEELSKANKDKIYNQRQLDEEIEKAMRDFGMWDRQHKIPFINDSIIQYKQSLSSSLQPKEKGKCGLRDGVIAEEQPLAGRGDKDWELVTVKSPTNTLTFDDSPFDNQLKAIIISGKKTVWEIHSVKRKDGVFFTIGDEVTRTNRDRVHKIIAFSIRSNILIAALGDGGYEDFISELHHLKRLP